MGRYEQLVERLPSLYRPDEDEAVDPLVPLVADGLAEVRDTVPVGFEARARRGALHVRLADAVPVRELRLAAGIAPGAGYVLELYRFAEPLVLARKPAAVVPVRDGVAPLALPFVERRFGLRLKRRGLLALVLLAIADSLERLNLEAAEVMQAHWFRFADRALYSPFFVRARELADPASPPPAASDPDVLRFPYVHDLARLGSLVSILPRQVATAQGGDGDPSRETVETYRERIARIVALYRNGLGTVEALRRMTEAQLPVDLDEPRESRDRPFSVEEGVPLSLSRLVVEMPGEPAHLVGPLMHWRTEGDGLEAAPPTVYVRAPTAGEREAAASTRTVLAPAAENPVIELFDPAALEPAVGLAYAGAIPDGKTLRLRPAFSSWLAGEDGVRLSRSEPGADAADPTAPGPWQPAEGGPDAPVAALLQTRDRVLWAGVGTGLWRLDGDGWSEALDVGAGVRALAEDGDDLLVASDAGFFRIAQHPEGGGLSAQAEPDPDGRTVHALLRGADGTWWLGTSAGLGRLGEGDAFEPFVLAADLATEVRALGADTSGALYAGTALGLFQYQPAGDRWYWYAGGEATDQAPEWEELVAATSADERNFPSAERVFLPAVTAVRRARDGALWIGTEDGPARYLAVADEGPLAYRTVLEAYPDLGAGRVFAIEEDERGLVWLATERGLFCFDGRDFLHFEEGDGRWRQLGRADSLYPPAAEPLPRGMWRYRRETGEWQRFAEELATPDWRTFDDTPRTTPQPAVRALAFTDGVVADLLDDWDPSTFASSGATRVDSDRLRLRFKLPGYERIVDGGLPAVPRVPAGEGRWRYLSLEPSGVVEPSGRPAWTIEGRLLPDGLVVPADAEPDPGRWDALAPEDAGAFGAAVYAYAPAVGVGMEWETGRRLGALVRLRRRSSNDQVDPDVLDGVWRGVQQVRPAGVRVALAVGGAIVRKES